MSEEESRQALFKLHQEYMAHSPKERLKLYSEYQKQRNDIKNKLAQNVSKKVK